MKKSTKTIVHTAIILFVVTVRVWCLGYHEKPLDYVDTLITNQRYDEAIIFLTDFIKNNPALFDSAQKRLKRINAIRSAYNSSASTLIDILKNDPLNQERKLAVIAELESYERVPNQAILEFVTKTKEFALFTYNQAQFDSIMEQAHYLIDNRRFHEAIKVYESGFSLYKAEFKNGDFEKTVVDDALNRIVLVSEEIQRFPGFALAMDDAFTTLSSTFQNHDNSAYVAAWNNAVSMSAELASLRKNIVNSGRALEASFVDIAAHDPAVTDSSFLPFAFRLVLGRKGGNSFEGIVGAIDAYWISTMGKAQSALDEIIKNEKTEAWLAYESNNWNGAVTGFINLSQNAFRMSALLSLWSHYVATDLFERSTLMGQTVLALKGMAYLAALHTARTARLCASVALIQADMEHESSKLNGYQPKSLDQSDRATILPSYEKHRAVFQNAGTRIEELAEKADEIISAQKSWTDAGFGSPDSQIASTKLSNIISEASQRARSLQITAVASAAGWEYGLLAQKSNKAETMLGEARTQLYGLPTENPVIDDFLFRYPVKAMTLFNAVEALEIEILDDFDTYHNRYASYPDFISESQDVIRWSMLADSLASRTKINQGEAKKLYVMAKDQKNLADYNKREAETRIAELKVALDSKNFIAAKDRLNLARERYQISLEFEYDEQLRLISDQALDGIASEIRKSENDLVVSDSRLFLDRSKDLYLQGEYEQAESALLQARMTWATTNSKPDFEIEYWLTMVKTALTIRADGTMSATSSAYTEVSNHLAMATQYYEEGSAYLSKKDKPAAISSFKQAMLYLEKVKSVSPSNEEALRLELEIDKLTDRAVFNKKLKNILSSAKSRVETSSELVTAYNDLKIIESIDPNYPGLSSLIEKAAILTGLKPPPPDPGEKANAKRMVKNAQNIFDKGQFSEFKGILSILEQAMKLDPGLETVGVLKDKVAMRLGGDTAMVLPSVAEALYRNAVKNFEKGNFIKARASLTNLLTVFPDAKTMKKVVELDARLTEMNH